MNTAFRFRIYPNREQQQLLAQFFGCMRFVYNYFLALHIDEYRFCHRYLSYTECAKLLTELKKLFPFLRLPDSASLQQVLRHLDMAFSNFFQRDDAGYPKFKSKSRSAASYTSPQINNNVRVEGKHIVLPKVGKVRAKIHRRIPEGYVLKSVTVSMTASGEYYASVLFEHESQVQNVVPKRFLGLDYSSPALYIDSDGNEPDYPRYFRKAEEKLAREQRKLSHMQYRSKNWYKQKRKVARVHRDIARKRKDFLHKLSRTLADSYDVICIEDLNMKAMARSLRLGKSTMDNGWGMFTAFLEYKLQRQGKRLVRISKWYPSTKTCHKCGNVKPIRLDDRTYVCPECGSAFDRDWNAAINIRNEGMRMLSV